MMTSDRYSTLKLRAATPWAVLGMVCTVKSEASGAREARVFYVLSLCLPASPTLPPPPLLHSQLLAGEELVQHGERCFRLVQRDHVPCLSDLQEGEPTGAAH